MAIIGGSLGAKRINETIASHLDSLLEQGLQVLWQTGKLYFDRFEELGKKDGVSMHAFIQHMDLFYSAADVLISRAGAGTISELCIVGKPVLFIPSPNVAEDHQTKNALSVVEKDAALMIRESELDSFGEVLQSMVLDAEKRSVLSKNIKKLALPDATRRIADEVEKIVK